MGGGGVEEHNKSTRSGVWGRGMGGEGEGEGEGGGKGEVDGGISGKGVRRRCWGWGN